MRAVLDPNVLISGILSANGPPAQILRHWLDGAFDMVASAPLLDELTRALAYPKIRKHLDTDDPDAFVSLVRTVAIPFEQPVNAPPIRSSDPGDDYLIALAAKADALLVSGDKHLLELRGRIPVYSSAEFLEMLESGR